MGYRPTTTEAAALGADAVVDALDDSVVRSPPLATGAAGGARGGKGGDFRDCCCCCDL